VKKGLTLTLLLIPILTIVALTVFYINSSSTIVYPGLAKEKEKALSEEKKKQIEEEKKQIEEKKQKALQEEQNKFESMAPKEHLEKAKTLAILEPETEKHLLKIPKDAKEWPEAQAILKKIKYAIHQKELDAKRRSIAQDKRAREQAIKIRKEIAAGLERQYLDNGADVYVTTSGSNHTTLRIKWVLMSRPEVYDTINRTREMDTFKALGFKEIVFSNGFGDAWTHRLN